MLCGIVPILLTLILCGCSKKEENAVPAPDFSITTVGDDQIVHRDDYKGKVLILDFWATWCPPCKREIPHFNELYDEYREKGLEILGVSVDRDGIMAVKQYLAKGPGPEIPEYPVAMASQDMIRAYGPISSIPVTFVIDKKGNVRKRLVGYSDISVFETILEELL